MRAAPPAVLECADSLQCYEGSQFSFEVLLCLEEMVQDLTARGREQVGEWDVVSGWAGGEWVETAPGRVPVAIVFAPIAGPRSHTGQA